MVYFARGSPLAPRPRAMTALVQKGDVIAGKYEVERVLGVGGMGVVVAATHRELDERVAIKLLRREVLSRHDIVERFAREGRAAVKIKSEHVARVIDVGRLADGEPFLVMEYLEGQDLSAAIEQRGKLPIPEVVEYVLQACEALAEAHALGIVHRDIKPANLFLTLRRDGTPCVKVLDFGISKGPTATAGGAASITSTSTVMGSPQYMSPEQLRSIKHADARSDIWSLGMVIYELVAGRVPFDAETMPELCVQIMTGEPTPLDTALPGVPRSFAALVRRCIERDPAARFASVAELAVALHPFAPPRAEASIARIHALLDHPARSRASQSSISAITPLPGSAITPLPSGSVSITAAATIPALHPVEAPAASKRRLFGASATAGAVIVAGAVAFGLRGRPSAPLQQADRAASASSTDLIAGAVASSSKGALPGVLGAELAPSAQAAASASAHRADEARPVVVAPDPTAAASAEPSTSAAAPATPAPSATSTSAKVRTDAARPPRPPSTPSPQGRDLFDEPK
jgi:eukaryotic-like serine/threonine-protein kinase